MEYPRFVYKNHGPHERPSGTYDYLICQNETEREMALGSGVWFDSVPEALGLVVESAVVEQLPSEEELEQIRLAEVEAEKVRLAEVEAEKVRLAEVEAEKVRLAEEARLKAKLIQKNANQVKSGKGK